VGLGSAPGVVGSCPLSPFSGPFHWARSLGPITGPSPRDNRLDEVDPERKSNVDEGEPQRSPEAAARSKLRRSLRADRTTRVERRGPLHSKGAEQAATLRSPCPRPPDPGGPGREASRESDGADNLHARRSGNRRMVLRRASLFTLGLLGLLSGLRAGRGAVRLGDQWVFHNRRLAAGRSWVPNLARDGDETGEGHLVVARAA